MMQKKGMTRSWTVLLAIMLLVPGMLFPTKYFAEDDYLMNYIANGSLGEAGRACLIYPNFLFGKALTVLYDIAPTVNWYLFALLAAVAAAFAMFHFTLVRLGAGRAAQTMCLAANLLAPFFVTFTISSYLISAAGLFLLSVMALEHRGTGRDAAIATGCFVGGFLIRPGTLISVVGLTIPLLVLLLCDVWHAEPARRKATLLGAGFLMAGAVLVQISAWIAGLAVVVGAGILFFAGAVGLRRFCACITAALLCCCGAQIINQVVISTPQWNDFASYTQARSYVLDYDFVEYADYAEELTALGVTETGYECLKTWSFADREVFSQDVLQKIHRLTPSKVKYELNTIQLLHEAFSSPVNAILFLSVPVVAAALMSFCEKKRRVGVWICAAFVLMQLTGLLLRRRLVLRVGLPLVVLSVLECLLIFRPVRKCRCAGALAIVAVVLFGMAGVKTVTRAHLATAQKEILKPMYSFLEAETHTLFVMPTALYNELYYEIPMLEVARVDTFDNVVKLGSGDTYSLRYYNQMNRFGLRQPDRLMLALAQESNVYYLAQNVDLIERYMTEQLDEPIKAHTIKEFADGVQVWTFQRL